MHRRVFSLALATVLVFGRYAHAQEYLARVRLESESKLPFGGQVCIPLSVAAKFAAHTDVSIICFTDPSKFSDQRPYVLYGQLTEPGILTESVGRTVKDLERRDLHFTTPGNDATTYDISVIAVPHGNEKLAWQLRADEFSDLLQGKLPLLRYVHASYDKSTPAKRDKTYKVFHHLSDPTGKRLITNGGDTNDPLPKNPKDQLYPHHRGLMYAFNEITFDGNKKCDTWHAKPGDTHQSHEGFLLQEEGIVLGRHRVAINWHGSKNEVFAKEEREVTVYRMDKGTLVDFASRLKTTGGLVKLSGDPQHAGFQFRAHNDLHEQKNDKLTYFLRPDGKGKLGETRNWDPKTKKGPINLPWDAMSFVIDGKRYTVAYLNHPKNPGESRWSERDYGRFGCYFEHELTEKNPLVVNYRIWLQEGEMTGEEVEALHRAFTQPPKVTVK